MGLKSRLLIGLDLDGTLVALRPRPGQVRLPPSTRRLLSRLARRPGVSVAIVSGRALPDLRRRAAAPGVLLGGNHGLELPGWVHPAARRARPRLEAALRELRAALPRLLIEDKRWSLSVHDRRGAAQAEVAAVARRRRLRLRRGKKVLELLPAADWHKGHALRKLAAGGRILYIGDDATDEEAFRSLGRGALTVKVGEGRTAARYRLADVGAVRRLLAALA